MWRSASGVCAVKESSAGVLRDRRDASGFLAPAGFWDMLTDLDHSLEVQSRRSDGGDGEARDAAHTVGGTPGLGRTDSDTSLGDSSKHRRMVVDGGFGFLGLTDTRKFISNRSTRDGVWVCRVQTVPCKSLSVAPQYVFGKV